jgi:hypothetical protein
MEQTLFSPLDKAAAAEQAARHHHYEAEIVTASFWSKAAASLPPQVRRRHVHLFEAAEQYEPVLEFIVDRCAGASSALGRLFGSRERARVPGARAKYT